MAAGTAGPPLEDLIRNNITNDLFWHPDGPSRSSSIKSKLDLSIALPSLPASPARSQALPSVPSRFDHSTRASPKFFVRSDADSLNDAIGPTSSYTKAHNSPKSSTMTGASAISTSPERPEETNTSTASPGISNTSNSEKAQTITLSPSQLDSIANAPASRPARPGRPTLTRLNTSEMLRTQTSTALEPPPTRPIASRRSPTALKLQLDTSVPRRSATMSSYPHASKSYQKALLHPPLSFQALDSPSRAASMTTELAAAASRSHADASQSASSSHSADSRLGRSNFSFEEFDFQVSTILPDFLYLGPNVQSEEAVEELRTKGVRRILNVACEIDEFGPLRLQDRFGRYLKLPMLDSVEAKGVQDSIEQACSFLDDARLRSEPVYVHCKAGKSRSVTIVIAYLIHALGWTLQRSYSHVADRRADICPNIGFVAELMRYEEKELKLPRSTGIYGNPADAPSPSVYKSWTPSDPARDQTERNDQSKANESAPALSTPSRDDVHQRLNSSKDTTNLGGALSKSSPDLTSMSFSSS